MAPSFPTLPMPRIQRAPSVSESSSSSRQATPPSPPYALRGAPHATRRNSIVSDTPGLQDTPPPPKRQPAVAPHYLLPPTVPSPFLDTLEASLDAILQWAKPHPYTQPIANTLLQEVDSSTDWPALVSKYWQTAAHCPITPRYVTEELLFLITRVLLPYQIAENRTLMARMYERKKQFAIRFLLRYDLLREPQIDTSGARDQAVYVASVEPVAGVAPPPPAEPDRSKYPYRVLLMRNIWPTLIQAPKGGWYTHGVKTRMRHHVTDLDGWLLLEDEEVEAWSNFKLMMKTSEVLLLWQWLRVNNEKFADLEVYGYDELEGKADDCDWVADDLKR